ncbi:putative xyloglucan endotransglucosylase/hydrolase protein 1 [Vitis vinifera]|uniref:Xyloglucan endotransglucosylase/hydrolase n=2 Tax=Vitis vinifera TaxID=29760 RepID=A0A438CBS6_VITVI|nr:putative xyloglucan endotransglucosylase/hydrolase protein 1 [Vitis vinifera]
MIPCVNTFSDNQLDAFITSSYLPFFSFFSLFAYLRLSTCAINPDKVSFDQNYYNTWGFYHFSSIKQWDRSSALYRRIFWFVFLSHMQLLWSGFMSNHTYGSGFFRMRMKIPNKDSLGIITTFYEAMECHTHWQTNVFSNDNGGREERVALWFDPTADFHTYKILWNQHQIVFYVDKIPIRVFKNNTGIGVNYPSQAMSVVGSLWSDTTWAAHGQQINWTQAPFVAYFQGFNINGCLKDIDSTSQCNSTHYRWNGPRYMGLDQTEIVAYEKVRRKYLTYSYCSDRGSLHPECPRRTLE